MNLNFRRNDIHNTLYHFGLALLVCCLPLSRFVLSLSQFILLLNWIAEGNFRKKFDDVRHNASILLPATIFLLYLAGFLFSDNKSSGIEKVRNALPLLVMPIILGTTPALKENFVKKLLLLFSAAVISAAIICVISYLAKGLPEGGDYRKLSVFIHPIRFAIMINMAIGIILYYSLRNQHGKPVKRQLYQGVAGIACTMFLVWFLFFLRSASGVIIFGMISLLFALNLAFREKKKSIHILVVACIAIIAVVLPGIIRYTWMHNFKSGPVDWTSLETHTVNGNPYVHDPLSVFENGHYQGIYLCEPELEREWNRRSTIPYDGKDLQGQNIRTTLQRYLTSKGLRKDSAAVHKLSTTDLRKIEKGLANYRFSENPGISQRLYETLWEIQIYRQSGYAQQHSFGQRLLFSKAAFSLMREKIWTGRGSGDVNNAMYQKAQQLNLKLDPKWEGKPHNQFAFWILAFGMAGFLWILGCLIYPVIVTKAYRYLLFNAFTVIILISMVIVDTIESYDSIVFFSFFYSLFIYRESIKKPD